MLNEKKILSYIVSETLHHSGRNLVLRAHRESDGRSVILKMPTSDFPSAVELARYRNEYEILRRIDHDGVIKVYALEKYASSLILVLEDFADMTLKELTENPLSFDRRLDLAVRITEIVGEIHRHDIIHKDLKPSNIFINSRTGMVKIGDFSISSTVSRENPGLGNIRLLEGSLPYISPEQTGRTSRAIDYRTDFYSLGVTLYELFTGKLPFNIEDPVELVHAHIARQPVPPHDLDNTIPVALSQIILKLMAKNGDYRYRSAWGVAYDLNAVRDAAGAGKILTVFTPGLHDVSFQFRLSQRLYGREAETAALLESATTLDAGGRELVLVRGVAGIGKSVLVHSIWEMFSDRSGFFIKGKFDQYKRNIPYGAIIHAFRELVLELLTGSAREMDEWKERIRFAIGDNCGLIAAVIPEIEFLTGTCTPPETLPPAESQNRFNRVFEQFVGLFTMEQRPLVLFLDDLQWADLPSLDLIKLLLTDRESGPLLVVGTYRDNEVSESHPLSLAIEDLRKGNVPIRSISPGPLCAADIAHFIADSLSLSEDICGSLARLVEHKTSGNPFFVNQFLLSLYEDGLIRFNASLVRWEWDIERIKARNFTDNVVELMTAKLNRFDEKTRELLKLAACIGGTFDIETLAVISGSEPHTAAETIEPAIRAGLIFPSGESYRTFELARSSTHNTVSIQIDAAAYRFLHDRVQQAAYQLIPENDRDRIHFTIGRLLIEKTSPSELSDRLFDIVNQINFGITLTNDPAEKIKFSELNLLAGKKARISAAFKPALIYFRAGIEFLGETLIATHYRLWFDLILECAECEYIAGNFERADQLCDMLLAKASNRADKALIMSRKLLPYSTNARYEEAMAFAIPAMKYFGIRISREPSAAAILAEYVKVRLQLRKIVPEKISEIAEARDPEVIAVMQFLTSTGMAGYAISKKFFVQGVLRLVSISLRYGQCEVTPTGLSAFASILGTAFGQYELGNRIGKAALEMAQRRSDKKLLAPCHYIYGSLVNHWRNPIRTSVEHLRKALQSGLEHGDYVYAGLSTIFILEGQFIMGAPTEELLAENDRFLSLMVRMKKEDIRNELLTLRQFLRSILGQTVAGGSFSDIAFDEESHLRKTEANRQANAFRMFYVFKAQALFIAGKIHEARSFAERAGEHLEGLFGLMQNVEHYFYYSLILAQSYREGGSAANKDFLKELAKNRKRLKVWAENAPENTLHRYLLVEAEAADLEKRSIDAMRLYDEAIRAASESGFTRVFALANELAFNFHLRLKHQPTALHYLRYARDAYARLQFKMKTEELESRYRELSAVMEGGYNGSRNIIETADIAGLIRSPGGATVTDRFGYTTDEPIAFDMHSIIKASQAISAEIVIERLLEKLVTIVIENAGAEKGAVVLKRAEGMFVEAIGKADGEVSATLSSLPLDDCEVISRGVVNYVVRTRSAVVLNDAVQSSIFATDHYILTKRPRSIMCLPIVFQQQPVGVIYLENNLSTGVFSKERLALLKILSAQIASALENSKLYRNIENALHEKERLTAAQACFVPEEFLSFLGKRSIVDVQLGDQVKKNLTILFADIRDFTALSEQMTPEENFGFLNSYLKRISPIINDYGGFIDKFIGDGVMALFPDNPEDALRAAISMQQAMQLYNTHRSALGYRPVRIGIGIHSGPCILGTIGARNRMETTVVSDTVNLASRMESLTKDFAASIIVSKKVYDSITDRSVYRSRFLGNVSVKGKMDEVPVWEYFDGENIDIRNRKEETVPQFEAGVTSFISGDLDTAEKEFRRLLEKVPEEIAAHYYLRKIMSARLERGLS